MISTFYITLAPRKCQNVKFQYDREEDPKEKEPHTLRRLNQMGTKLAKALV